MDKITVLVSIVASTITTKMNLNNIYCAPIFAFTLEI